MLSVQQLFIPVGFIIAFLKQALEPMAIPAILPITGGVASTFNDEITLASAELSLSVSLSLSSPRPNTIFPNVQNILHESVSQLHF